MAPDVSQALCNIDAYGTERRLGYLEKRLALETALLKAHKHLLVYINTLPEGSGRSELALRGAAPIGQRFLFPPKMGFYVT